MEEKLPWNKYFAMNLLLEKQISGPNVNIFCIIVHLLKKKEREKNDLSHRLTQIQTND